MINSLIASITRVTIFWYVLGLLVMFLGSTQWAEARYSSLALLPWVPPIELRGIRSAAEVQWVLLVYWTVPVFFTWLVSIIASLLVCEAQCQWKMHHQRQYLRPSGKFWGVYVAPYSLGTLPLATTPKLTGPKVYLNEKSAPKGAVVVELAGSVKEAVKLLTAGEQQLCEELIQLLLANPEHYAGLGHGVGLLEHTLNVVSEAAEKCTSEFRLPLVAALAHDIGKLVTFKPDGKGGWQRKGLHSRESARILVTLPGFAELPQLHQDALLLAVKYDHAPSKMPSLAGNKESAMLAMRIINALSQSDKTATAAEKDRHLERLQPEDLLFKDFVDFLREAPVVQKGKPGVSNQVNNPDGSPYLYIYEAAWRDAAVRRMPAEVAAALDLTRRDAGKLAKYTKILAERLRKEGLLVETYDKKEKDGTVNTLAVSESNPLWDIQSGTGEKAVVLRGILVVHADALWKKVNYRLGTKSPYPVQILAPNADTDGRVNSAPAANREVSAVDTSDSFKLSDIKDGDALAAIGLADPVAGESKKVKKRSRYNELANTSNDDMFGLEPAKPYVPPQPKPAAPASEPEPDTVKLTATHDPVLPADTSSEASPEAPTYPVYAEAPAQATATPEEEPPTDESLAAQNEPDAEVIAEQAYEKSSPAAAAPEKAAEAPSGVGTPKNKSAARRSQFGGSPALIDPTELSWSEKKAGLALADEAAVAKYPNLQIGDKYYTDEAPAVKAGQAKPGSRYKGAKESNSLSLSAGGPKRAKRTFK